jgi:hypothetical protein
MVGSIGGGRGGGGVGLLTMEVAFFVRVRVLYQFRDVEVFLRSERRQVLRMRLTREGKE